MARRPAVAPARTPVESRDCFPLPDWSVFVVVLRGSRRHRHVGAGGHSHAISATSEFARPFARNFTASPANPSDPLPKGVAAPSGVASLAHGSTSCQEKKSVTETNLRVSAQAG